MQRFISGEIVFYLCLLILPIVGFFFVALFPGEHSFAIFMATTGLSGLGVAAYIFYAKNFRQHLACPVGSNCNAVIQSRYAQFLGVPLEYFGMAYYLCVVSTYVSFIIEPSLRATILLPAILIVTASAFLFSLYLTFIQAAILKQWCIWCLLSAAVSTILFVASLANISFAGTALHQLASLLTILKDLGFIIGLGTATAALRMFAQFIRDTTISDTEARFLQSVTEVLWLSLGMTLLSEFARFISNPEVVGTSDIFIVEVAALSVVCVAGAALKILFTPFLPVMSFADESGTDGTDRRTPLESMRRGMLIFGTLALTSWYYAFMLNFTSGYPLPVLLMGYIIFIIAALCLALLWEHRLSRSKM